MNASDETIYLVTPLSTQLDHHQHLNHQDHFFHYYIPLQLVAAVWPLKTKIDALSCFGSMNKCRVNRL